MGISCRLHWGQVSYSFLCVSGGLEINILRYAALSRKALDGVQLLYSLVVDSITSPYIDGSGERIPSKSDQRDYKPPRTRSFKPHLCCLQGPQYITPSVQCIYQSPLLQVSQDQMKREEWTGQTGVSTQRGQENVKHGRRHSNDASNGCRSITRGWQWAGNGGLDGSHL